MPDRDLMIAAAGVHAVPRSPPWGARTMARLTTARWNVRLDRRPSLRSRPWAERPPIEVPAHATDPAGMLCFMAQIVPGRLSFASEARSRSSCASSIAPRLRAIRASRSTAAT